MLSSLNTALTPLGHVVTIGGSSAGIRLAASPAHAAEPARITIGNFLGIATDASCVVAVITNVDGSDKAGAGQTMGRLARADLLGEIRTHDNGSLVFQRGITRYPMIGDAVRLLSGDSLRMVFDTCGAAVIKIGKLQQDASIEASVKVDDMLGKHFALLGSTGVGKSSGVAVLLRAILEVRPNLR